MSSKIRIRIDAEHPNSTYDYHFDAEYPTDPTSENPIDALAYMIECVQCYESILNERLSNVLTHDVVQRDILEAKIKQIKSSKKTAESLIRFLSQNASWTVI